MVSDRQNALLQRLDKAAKILDLLGDIPHALQVLQANLEDPEIQNYKTILLETLVFLADLYVHLGKVGESERYLQKAQCVDLKGIDPVEAGEIMEKLQRIRAQIDTARP